MPICSALFTFLRALCETSAHHPHPSFTGEKRKNGKNIVFTFKYDA